MTYSATDLASQLGVPADILGYINADLAFHPAQSRVGAVDDLLGHHLSAISAGWPARC
jgi:hypothetical protein